MGDDIGEVRAAASKRPFERTTEENAAIARNQGDQQVRNNGAQGVKDQKDFGHKDIKR